MSGCTCGRVNDASERDGISDVFLRRMLRDRHSPLAEAFLLFSAIFPRNVVKINFKRVTRTNYRRRE